MINPPNPPQTTQGGYGAVSPGDSSSSGDRGATARSLGEEAKAQGREQLEGLRGSAAENLDRLAEGAQAAASTLQRDDVGHLSEYISDLATRMTQLSTSLRTRSGDEILHDVGRMARENPALFVTGSVALGFGLARFARASQQHASQKKAMQETTSQSATAYGGTAGDSAWSPQTGTHDFAASGAGVSGTSTSTTNHPIDPASSQTGPAAGTQGGIH